MGRGRGAHAVLVLACVLAGITGVAQGEPVIDSEDARNLNEQISGNKHEDVRHWTQIGGAPHPTGSVIEGSPTPYDADLFAVRFQNAHLGFAGGSVCAGPGEPATPEEADTCDRVPAIYGTADGREWTEYRFDQPGYVGGIAWINNRTALAVGGTGTYPRREPNPPGDEWDYERRAAHDREHGAGDARAWLYEDGSWHEITDRLPEGMRGLSALDVWIGREADGSEWGVAGAYGQLWEWRDGRFSGNRLDKDSPTLVQGEDSQWSLGAGDDPQWSVVNGPAGSAGSSDPALFHYRVREIRIAPDRTQKRAFAFTAGCCGPSSAGGSRRIEYVPSPRKDAAGVPPEEAPPPAGRPRWVVSTNDYGDSVYSFSVAAGTYGNNHFGGVDQFDEPAPKYGSPTWNAGQTIVSPGGPEAGDSTQGPRYVASDGDTEPSTFQKPYVGNAVPDWSVGAHRSADPAVDRLGLLQTTVVALRPEYGGIRPRCSPPRGRIAAETFFTLQDEFYLGHDAAAGRPPGDSVWICRTEQIQAGQTPSLEEEGPLRTRESGLQPGPSWGLNAIDMLDMEGAGFAVGDRGAILRIEPPPAVESDPPPVGGRRPAPLTERSSYDALRPPPAGEVGGVPPIAAQPRQRLPEPRLYRAGSPDANEAEPTTPPEDVDAIVMSRTGEEGWAIGPSPEARDGVMTLHRYDGARWTRCDPIGTQFTEPDPACEELGPLYLHQDAGKRIRLTAAARVPVENDADPSNDDELEIVAAGTTLETVASDGATRRPVPTVIRYTDGRWHLEDLAVRRTLNPDVGGQGNVITPIQLVFTSPSEGWMVASVPADPNAPVLHRFDGTGWIDCSTRQLGPGETTQVNATGPLVNREACGDTEDRLPALDRRGTISLAAAGDRVYLAATRPPPRVPDLTNQTDPVRNSSRQLLLDGTPMILYRSAGEQWRVEGGGHDPGADDPDAPRGGLTSISVARRTDGTYEGWAVGVLDGRGGVGLRQAPEGVLLRLAPGSSQWQPWQANDAAQDYLVDLPFSPTAEVAATKVRPSRQLTLPGSGAKPGRAFIAWSESPHALAFNPERGRWEVAEKPGGSAAARPMAFAPDGRGGAWAAYATGLSITSSNGTSDTYFYDYTDTPPREVFTEVANPIAARDERPTALAGAPDGTVWLATNSEAVYRYDRLTGWERARIPGWDPGRVVTRRSQVKAIAVAPDGQGLAVGEGGKIAEISPSAVRLDDAAGTVCRAGSAAPCGTSFELRAVAVAPDGSALAGGEGLTLLWRPGGGELRRIATPGASASATITGIAMPSPDRAWLALDDGQVFAGSGDGQGDWAWELENQVEIADQDRLLSEGPGGQPTPLRAIAVDGEGHGYAVGDRGVVLERTGNGTEPWRRIDAGVSEDLTAVALPAGAGSGALIGGERGLIITRSAGELHIARAGDRLRPDNGDAVGLALLPGTATGQVEAWAAIATGGGASQLLHYASDPDEPLLDAGDTGARAAALPDVPAPTPGEISFAAFGRSDCHQPDARYPCPPLEGTTELHETVLRRTRDEILGRSQQPGGPDFAIHTGDAYDTAGLNALEAVEQHSRFGAKGVTTASTGLVVPQWTGGFKFRRLNEQLLDPIADAGLPLFGAVGSRDLSETRQCVIDSGISDDIICAENRDRARVGENVAWRQAMAAKPAPWGSGEPVASNELTFEPIPDSDNAIRSEDVETAGVRVPAGGASTHYAADIVRDGGQVARLVVTDTSLGSLTASDPLQQPLEGDGGQVAWLERVLCIEGSAGDTGQCTRGPDQQAIVVSNTPTYSYGPTTPSETEADAAVFESIMLRHRASVVVSGRLGWNGRYWALAPGIHEPCPGGDYVADDNAPESGAARLCGTDIEGALGDADQLVGETQDQVTDALGQTGGVGALPFVVASGAGGRFDALAESSGQASANQGFWRGYTIVHLDPSGDSRKTVVEQRPILDWVSIEGADRVLRARQKLALRGTGREPIGPVRFDEISTPAITHRFALLAAEPDQPWLPKEGDGDCAPYACLDASIGSIDPQSGLVKAGDGRYPRTFAVAELSVGEQSATYPLVFEPRAAFRLAPPARPPAVAVPPPVSPPAPAQPTTPSVDLPPAPVLPVLTAQALAPPPVPPSPPAVASQTPLDLNLAPAALDVNPPTAVSQPPTPPVNPAPPGGARREARQRQAAAQKSGADSAEEEAPEVTEGGGDTAVNRPGSSAMSRSESAATRRERRRPTPSLTAVPGADQPSAWTRDALIGGGLGIAALILALGLNNARPTPRRREPELPAPAWARRDR